MSVNNEAKYIFQENGHSPALHVKHGPKINDNFLLRVWIVNPDSNGTLTLQISELNTEEWVDVVDSEGAPITFSGSMSTLFQTGSDCQIRWKMADMTEIASPVNPLDLDETVRYNLDEYPTGSVKVGIRFR